jgi:ketosteroid isomerase-like protein
MRSPIILTTLFVTVTPGRALAADVTEAELMQAAMKRGRQYDANYAKMNPAAMAALYAPDGLLVSPTGPIVRGLEALRTYYTNPFASGARGHPIKVVEVHVQGNGGYGLIQFSVTVPTASGGSHEVRQHRCYLSTRFGRMAHAPR